MKCKRCGNKGTIQKAGKHHNRTGVFQKYKCTRCGSIKLGEMLEEFELV